MKPAVAEAIDQLRAAFISSEVTFEEDGHGGAYVMVEQIGIGASFDPSTTWLGFHITYPYPDADVYPLFVDAGIKYVGSRAVPNKHPDGDLPAPMTRGAEMPGFKKKAIQVSRRSNRRDPATDSAMHKVLRVIEFLESL